MSTTSTPRPPTYRSTLGILRRKLTSGPDVAVKPGPGHSIVIQAADEAGNRRTVGTMTWDETHGDWRTDGGRLLGQYEYDLWDAWDREIRISRRRREAADPRATGPCPWTTDTFPYVMVHLAHVGEGTILRIDRDVITDGICMYLLTRAHRSDHGDRGELVLDSIVQVSGPMLDGLLEALGPCAVEVAMQAATTIDPLQARAHRWALCDLEMERGYHAVTDLVLDLAHQIDPVDEYEWY